MLWKTLIWHFLLICHFTNIRVILVQKMLFATNIIQFQLHVYCIKPLVARFGSIHDVIWFNYNSFFSFPNVCSNSKVSPAFPPKNASSHLSLPLLLSSIFPLLSLSYSSSFLCRPLPLSCSSSSFTLFVPLPSSSFLFSFAFLQQIL